MENNKIEPIEPAHIAMQGLISGICLGAVLWVVIIDVVQWMLS